MDLIGAQLAQAYPKALEGKGVTLAPWREQITGQPLRVAARPGWRVDLRVADRVHQSRQPVDVAGAGAPIRIRRPRRDRRQRRSAGASDVDRQFRARRRRRSAGHHSRGCRGAAARAPRPNQSADRRGAANRSADACRHVAAHHRRRDGVWPVACAPGLPQDRWRRAQGWRTRRHEPRHRETPVLSRGRGNRRLGGVNRHRRITDSGAPERAARRPGLQGGQRADGTDDRCRGPSISRRRSASSSTSAC